MNIMHICLNGPFNDNWSYQDNILPKYHKKLGNHVTIIAKNEQHNDLGEIIEIPCADYIDINEIRIIRVKKNPYRIKAYSRRFIPYDIYKLVCDIRPEFIMIHGLIGSTSALQVKKYIDKVNRECILVADTHQDYHNSYMPYGVRKYLVYIRRFLNKRMFPYYKKIFYIAPLCKKFALEYYKVPEDMLELLPLGCDPEYIDFDKIGDISELTRKKYELNIEDIIICHGGKMDEKKMTFELIQAVKRIKQEVSNVKMIIFGSFSKEYQKKIHESINENQSFIKYAGMLSTKEYYNIYLSSDIAAFPGGQSVLWQQAIACGLALAVKKDYGLDYLDLGGNIVYFEDCSINSIYSTLKNIIFTKKYLEMKKIAKSKGMNFFSYEKIAKRVLDINEG